MITKVKDYFKQIKKPENILDPTVDQNKAKNIALTKILVLKRKENKVNLKKDLNLKIQGISQNQEEKKKNQDQDIDQKVVNRKKINIILDLYLEKKKIKIDLKKRKEINRKKKKKINPKKKINNLQIKRKKIMQKR